MIPLDDDRLRNQPFPWMTMLLVLANVLVFLLEVAMGPQLEEFVNRWGAIPMEILAGRGLITLVTSTFLHGGWVHLFSNMVFLRVFGDNIEAVLGPLGYLFFYLIGGAVAALAHALAMPTSTVPSVGASGAIAAVMGAYLVMFPRARVRVLLVLGFFITTTRVSAVAFLGVWALTQLLNGVASLSVQTAQTAGVAYWAHIGGFAFGFIVGLLFRERAKRLVAEPEPWFGRYYRGGLA